MSILVTGAKGLLGSELCGKLDKMGYEYYGIDIEDVDICDGNRLESIIYSIMPEKIIHCAAYTAVDMAEQEPDKCYQINVEGTKNIINICAKFDIELLFISTDYVFSGDGTLPYEITSSVAPINVYGKSKAEAEKLVYEALEKYYIVRTSWLFGENGDNFVDKIIQKLRTRCNIEVVCDQVGSPTYANDLAEMIIDIVFSKKYGTYHVTNEGYCSWYEFACEIATQMGSACMISPVTSEALKNVNVKRPKNSMLCKDVLDHNSFRRLPMWKDALSRYLRTITNGK